jgi:universal stress protein F
VQRILVALDESERAAQVLETAVKLARSVGGKLFLLRVCPIPTYPYPLGVYALAPDMLPAVLEENTRRTLAQVEETVPAPLRGGAHVKLGVAWQQICSMATELDVDLIVIGAHGYHLVDRVLGTTSARVVNHADRSVLVVRGPEAARRVP